MTALFILHFFVAGTLADEGDDTGWGRLASGGLFSFGNFEYYSRRASATETCRVQTPLITDKQGHNYSHVDWDEVGPRGTGRHLRRMVQHQARRRAAAHVLFEPPHIIHDCASFFLLYSF
jgi:hypothetical protein